MQIDLNTLQQCKFKGNDVYEIFYNNVKIWPIETSEPTLNFIDPVPEGDYLSFAPVINTDVTDIKMKHWCIDFKVFYYYYKKRYNNLFNNTNGIVFGEKRIDKFINGQFIEGTWEPIRFEEDVNIYYNEILRVRWSDNLNVNWNDVKSQYIATNLTIKVTKVNITVVCLLKQNNSYSITNDECYIYGKLKGFKDNSGNYIDKQIDISDDCYPGDINNFFVPPEQYTCTIVSPDSYDKPIYDGYDFVHKHNLIFHPINKLELIDPTIIINDTLGANINAKCYNTLQKRNFGGLTIINNLELEFTEKIDDNWLNKWTVELYGCCAFNPGAALFRLKRVNNFKITVNEYESNLKWSLTRCFSNNRMLEYVKLDYDGVLNADNAKEMFWAAGENVEHPVLVKRGGAATVDRQAIGLGDNWIIKDFDEE